MKKVRIWSAQRNDSGDVFDDFKDLAFFRKFTISKDYLLYIPYMVKYSGSV